MIVGLGVFSSNHLQQAAGKVVIGVGLYSHESNSDHDGCQQNDLDQADEKCANIC